MTVIVYRDGIMAADGGGWQYDILVTSNTKKIIRLPDGGLAGFCGRRAAIEVAHKWLLGGGEKPAPEPKDELFGLIARPGGRVERVDWDFRSYEAEAADFYVVGANGEFLLGALAAGASASEAVRLATLFCDGAGGKVDWMRVGE